VLIDIYAASEKPIAGVTTPHLLGAMKEHGQRNTHYVATVEELPEALEEMLVEGDLLLTLGAGNIVRAGEQLLEILGEQGVP